MKAGQVLSLVLVFAGVLLLYLLPAPIGLVVMLVGAVILVGFAMSQLSWAPSGFEREVVGIMKEQLALLEALETRISKLEEKAPKPRKVLSTVKETADGGYESTSGVPEWKEVSP